MAADLRPRPLAGTRAEAATLLVQGIEGGSLPLAAIASTARLERFVGEDGSVRVRLPIVIEVPGSGLPEAVAAAPALEFYVYALTPTGAVASHLGLAVDLEPGRLAGQTGVRLIATLDLPPATYSLRFLVLEPESHRFGLRLLDLTLPGQGEATTLSRPTVHDPCAGWLVARTVNAPALSAAALPVLLIGRRNSLSSELVGGPLPGTADELTATIRLAPTNAERNTSHLLASEPIAGERERSVEVAFDLPPIGRGVYRLSLTLEGATSLTSPPVDVWVVDVHDLGPAPAEPCAHTWSGVIAHSSGQGDSPVPSPATAIDPAETQSPRVRAERFKLRRAYRGVLEQLAAGADVGTAAEKLCEMESGRSNVQTRLQTLLRNQLEVAKRLAATEPEILPVLMMLHHEAYLGHRSREQFPLAGHSVRVVQALAELMVDRRLPEESQALAAQILTSLAEHGHRSRMLVPSQLALQDALEMDSNNRDALLLLAVNYEWFGRYTEAAPLLERLVGAAATDSEARLRLGIMRRRVGQTEEAERDFRRILRESAPPWLLSLSYQALAGLLHEQGRHGEAVDLLRVGRSRLGSDQRLHILSAHALDRAGRAGEARKLLARLPIDGSSRTPRFEYGESLTSPLTSLRAGVDRGVAVRLPPLRRAIEETSG